MKPRYIRTGSGALRATPDSIKVALKQRGIYQTDIARKLAVRPAVVWSVLHGHVRSARIEAELSRVLGMPVVLDLEKKTPGALALENLEAELAKKGKTLSEWATERGFSRNNLGWLRTGKSLATCGNARRLCIELGLPTGKRRCAPKNGVGV